jgi:hypothetical protein
MVTAMGNNDYIGDSGAPGTELVRGLALILVGAIGAFIVWLVTGEFNFLSIIFGLVGFTGLVMSVLAFADFMNNAGRR